MRQRLLMGLTTATALLAMAPACNDETSAAGDLAGAADAAIARDLAVVDFAGGADLLAPADLMALPDFPPPACAACDASSCCGPLDQCVAIGDSACALADGSCVDCNYYPDGRRCIGSGGCGCIDAGDCPHLQACVGGLCTTACDVTTPCYGGCCDLATGRCAEGDTQTVCGSIGNACTSCAGDPLGSACRPAYRQCGCITELDCPVGSACDPATGHCTQNCGIGKSRCHGGCCATATDTCQAGTTTSQCGAIGRACTDCVAAKSAGFKGGVCLPTADGGFCGCSGPSDCPSTSSGCDAASHLCTIPCTNGSCNANAGCCNGTTCAPGTSDSACGAGVCDDCTATVGNKVCNPLGGCGCNTSADCLPRSVCTYGHGCSFDCSPGTSPCLDGCCTPFQDCVAGDEPTRCGKNGPCWDCRNVWWGHVCVAGRCGCNGAADCPTGTACNRTTHTCDSACGDAARTPCNGGCCLAGHCAPGSASRACGTSGGACNDCGATARCVSGTCQ